MCIKYIVQYLLTKVYILYKTLFGSSNNQLKHDIRQSGWQEEVESLIGKAETVSNNPPNYR